MDQNSKPMSATDGGTIRTIDELLAFLNTSDGRCFKKHADAITAFIALQLNEAAEQNSYLADLVRQKGEELEQLTAARAGEVPVWLLESTEHRYLSPPRWFEPFTGYTSDATKATRFADESSAKAFRNARLGYTQWKMTEHLFVDAALPQKVGE